MDAKDISESDVENDMDNDLESGGNVGSGDKENETGAVDVDEEFGIVWNEPDEESVDNVILTLPPEANILGTPEGNARRVPGGCAICLCPYKEGEAVTWSRKESCRHCFHANCVIPWLARQNEPKCPLCRQYFCTIEPVPGEEQLAHRQSSLAAFGLIPHAIATPVRSRTNFFSRIRNHSSMQWAWIPRVNEESLWRVVHLWCK